AQQVATVLNALCKWPDNQACAAAANTLAERLRREPDVRDVLKPREMTNALNALSKWPDTPACAGAASALAARVADDPRLRVAFDVQQVATV
ncbi:MAG: hypothetical protein G3W70_24330, partial [Xanthomonas perforans]|nr:hypothetical protein [Xanthomonas perforans]